LDSSQPFLEASIAFPPFSGEPLNIASAYSNIVALQAGEGVAASRFWVSAGLDPSDQVSILEFDGVVANGVTSCSELGFCSSFAFFDDYLDRLGARTPVFERDVNPFGERDNGFG
jgi:hypothetical protein